MLHRTHDPLPARRMAWAVFCGLLGLLVLPPGLSGSASAGPDETPTITAADLPGPIDDPFTAAERERLRARVRPLTVVVRRSGALPPGMWAPGGAQTESHGLWHSAGRVVTASAAVDGWPGSRRDRIEVELSDGRRFEAAVGVTEAALGLAVLDVPRLPAPPKPPDAGGPDAMVSMGRPLYAADATGLLHRLVVQRRGVGQHAYYWRLLGRVAPGTPLFDPTGRAVTLAGRDTDDGGATLALPAKALRALLERDDWIR